jgi:hypothetical protein
VDQLGPEYHHLLLKSHTLDDLSRHLFRLGAIKTIYTHRDPFDAIASYMRMFNQSFEIAFSAIRRSFELYRLHQGDSCTLPYECVVHSPLEAVRRVKEYLGLDVSEKVLVQIASETGMEAMKNIGDQLESAPPESLVCVNGLVYDRRTLLHKRHIRDGNSGYGRSMLSAEQQRMVEEAFPGLIDRRT